MLASLVNLGLRLCCLSCGGLQALADARWGPHTAWEERGYSWKTIVLSVAVMTQSACTVLLYLSFVYTGGLVTRTVERMLSGRSWA